MTVLVKCAIWNVSTGSDAIGQANDTLMVIFFDSIPNRT